MLVTKLKSKIAYAKVTQTELFYVGSITIDENIMKRAALTENEKVQVVNINNGSRIETYVIKGEAGSGNIVEAVRHMRQVKSDIKKLTTMDREEMMAAAKDMGAPFSLVEQVAKIGKLPVPNFAAGGVATPADLEAVMGSIIHTNVTNTGSVTLPYNEVWFFLDGGERLQSMESILGGPGVSTNWYSGETTYLQWQFNTPTDFENMAVSASGFNIARNLD